MAAILHRYSDTAPPDIRDIVRGIPDGGYTRFRTPVLCSEGKSPREHWLQAWKNPQTKLWTVNRLERLVVADKSAEKKSAIQTQSRMLSAVCFFDALHACGRYMADEKQWGAVEAPWADSEGDAADFKDVARKTGQPIDLDGLVHPAAYGEILTEGNFDEGACLVSSSTAGQELMLISGESIQTGFFDDLIRTDAVPVDMPRAALVEKNARQQNLINIFKQARSAIIDIYDTLRVAEKYHFIPVFSSPERCKGEGNRFSDRAHIIWAHIVVLPALHGYLTGHHRYALRRTFDQACRKLDRLAQQLPDAPEKKMLQNFNHAARATYRLEQAAWIYADSKKGGLSRRYFEKGLKVIDRAVKERVLDAGDAEKLKFDYLNGTFFAPGTLSEKLGRIRNEARYTHYGVLPEFTGMLEGVDTALQVRINALQSAKDIAFQP